MIAIRLTYPVDIEESVDAGLRTKIKRKYI